MRFSLITFAVLGCFLLPHTLAQSGKRALDLPGGRADGSVLLPNQWSLRPVGRQVPVGDFPANMAVHPSGRYAAILHCGYGKHEVVVISDGLWRQRFGADPAVIGRTLRIDTKPHTIVGVMPANFRYLSSAPKRWTPLCFSDDERKADRRHANNMDMIARLRP